MAEGLRFGEGLVRHGKSELIRRLHREAPLFRDPGGFWVASRYEDVRAILLDHASFSSAAMGGPSVAFPLLTDDPPRHTVLRGLLARAFTPASIAAMRPAIEALARELAARIPTGEEVDIVEAMTTPLPVAVIAGMLGVPESERGPFKRWSDAIVGIQEGPMTEERVRNVLELRAYFSKLAALRRSEPGDDLISALLRVEHPTESLSDEQVVGFAILLMIAGNETTTNLLGNLLHRLAARPECWRTLRDDRSSIELAIEESLRVDSPAQLIMRRTRCEVSLAGCTIPANELVLVYLAAANRDPSKWDDAARFELGRPRDRHIAFGHGVHTCIGAPLARLEAQSAMHALVDRFGSIEPGSQPAERLITGVLFGFRHLYVVFR